MLMYQALPFGLQLDSFATSCSLAATVGHVSVTSPNHILPPTPPSTFEYPQFLVETLSKKAFLVYHVINLTKMDVEVGV